MKNGNARANTMFKLTYQAYILFALTMGYGIYRLLIVTRNKLSKVLAGIVLFFLVWTFGYLGNSVKVLVWGCAGRSADYQGLDATHISWRQQVPEDASAIRWLKANINGFAGCTGSNRETATLSMNVCLQLLVFPR